MIFGAFGMLNSMSCILQKQFCDILSNFNDLCVSFGARRIVLLTRIAYAVVIVICSVLSGIIIQSFAAQEELYVLQFF